MKYKQNLHQHTAYCDGKDTPEQVLDTALQKGFDSVGFSGHSYMHWSPAHSMSVEGTARYREHITRLKAEYADQIKVFLGLEMDIFSEVDTKGYDYLIGSMHYFKLDGEYSGFDRSLAEVRSVIDRYFDGDGLKFAVKYYETVKTLPQYGKFDIIGHFDLVAKQNDAGHFFDEDSPAYRELAMDAINTLAGKIPYFEVNTGCISRGYRSRPYPAPFLIEAFLQHGFGAVITSDCHDADAIDCHFEESVQLLKDYGYRSYFVLTENGFEEVKM